MKGKSKYSLAVIGAFIAGIGAGTAKEGAVTEGVIILVIGLILFLVFGLGMKFKN